MSISIMPIDTQQMVNSLTAAGIPQAHAGAIASVIVGTVERHHGFITETLCSKLDLDHAVLALQKRIDAIEEKMATKEDLANLRTAISRAENRIILWVIGGFILAQLLPDFLQRLGKA